LTDIGTHVPYYRELFATRGFDPQTITSTADLQALPFRPRQSSSRTVTRRAADAQGLARFNTVDRVASH
jgi:phenylacetate-CoA ligase